MDISDRVFQRERSEETGITVKAYQVDLQDRAGIKAAAEDMIATYGKVDILANVAGMAYFGTEEIFKT